MRDFTVWDDTQILIHDDVSGLRTYKPTNRQEFTGIRELFFFTVWNGPTALIYERQTIKNKIFTKIEAGEETCHNI